MYCVRKAYTYNNNIYLEITHTHTLSETHMNYDGGSSLLSLSLHSGIILLDGDSSESTCTSLSLSLSFIIFDDDL